MDSKFENFSFMFSGYSISVNQKTDMPFKSSTIDHVSYSKESATVIHHRPIFLSPTTKKGNQIN